MIFAAWQWSRDERLSKSNREVMPGIWQIDLYSLIDQASKLSCRKDSRSAYFITLPAPDLVNVAEVPPPVIGPVCVTVPPTDKVFA